MNLWRCNIGAVIDVQIWAIISQLTGVGGFNKVTALQTDYYTV